MNKRMYNEEKQQKKTSMENKINYPTPTDCKNGHHCNKDKNR